MKTYPETMSFESALLQCINIPAFVRENVLHNINDIPVRKITNSKLFLAEYRFDFNFEDILGNSIKLDHIVAGMGDNIEKARFFCFMEMLERYSATSHFTIRNNLISSHNKLPSISWEELSPYSNYQLNFINSSRIDSKHKVIGQGLLTGIQYSIPAESVFPWWKTYCPPSNNFLLPESEGVGCAAGLKNDVQATLYRALSEVIERDAVMLSWRVPSWPVYNISKTEIPNDYKNWAFRENLTISLFDVGDLKLLPVTLAILSNSFGEEVTIGCSCGKSRSENIAKAISEAAMLRLSAQYLDPITPSFTPDQIDCSELHVLHAWRNGKEVSDWYKGKALNETLPHISNSPSLDNQLLKSCRMVFGYEPMAVDLTDPRLADSPYQVLRVVQPGAYKKEYRHRYPYLGGRRLKSLGCKASDLNLRPHPIG